MTLSELGESFQAVGFFLNLSCFFNTRYTDCGWVGWGRGSGTPVILTGVSASRGSLGNGEALCFEDEGFLGAVGAVWFC